MTTVPAEAGKSSWDLIDQSAFFEALPLDAVRRAVDLGCGAGRYTVPLAERLAPSGTVHGADLWVEGLNQLLRAARERGFENVTAEAADLARLTSLRDGEADLALMATVVHDLAARGTALAALREAARVVRQGGWLAVVEFKKHDTHPGPPLAIRLAPEELESLVVSSGFSEGRIVDLGPNLYLALYRREAI